MSLLVGIGFEDKKIFIEYKGEHFTFDESIAKGIFKDMKEHFEPNSVTIPLEEYAELKSKAIMYWQDNPSNILTESREKQMEETVLNIFNKIKQLKEENK